MRKTKYTVKPTTQFKKDYKRAIKRGRKIELLEKLVWQMKTAKGVAHHPIRWWSDALFLFVDKKGAIVSIPGGFTPQFRRLETGVPM